MSASPKIAPTAASCQAGDPEREQQLLRLEQPREHVRPAGRQQPPDQPTGALVQRAGRRAVGLPLDPAVRGVRRRASTPASSRARVFTQVPWPSRLVRTTGRSATTASSACRVGVPPGKNSIDQPPPTIHSRSGLLARVVGHDVQALLGRLGAVQVALQHREAAHDGVDVRVLEPGQQQSAGEVDDLGRGPASCAARRPGRPPRCGPRTATAARRARPRAEDRAPDEQRVDVLAHVFSRLRAGGSGRVARRCEESRVRVHSDVNGVDSTTV